MYHVYMSLRLYCELDLRTVHCFAMHKRYLWGVHCFYVALGTKAQREFKSIKGKVVVTFWVIWENQGVSSEPCARSTTIFSSVEPSDDPSLCCLVFLLRETVSIEKKDKLLYVTETFAEIFFRMLLLLSCCDQGPKSETKAKKNLCQAVCSM